MRLRRLLHDQRADERRQPAQRTIHEVRRARRAANLQRLQGEALYNVCRVRYCNVYKVRYYNVYGVTLVLQRARGAILQRLLGAILQRLQGETLHNVYKVRYYVYKVRLQRVQGDTLVLQRARCAILQRLLGCDTATSTGRDSVQRLQGDTLHNVYKVRYYVYKVKLCNVYRVTLVLQRARGAILYSVNKVGYWSNTLCNVYKVRHWSRTLQRVRGRTLEFDTIRRTCIRWLGHHTPSSRLTY